ncbi:MAG TPA: hypothetical protein VGU44_02160, partial [Gammaproteobacteria bacterium]|nr:hypothetical protein [Gammaproteobacteria bacterium]
QFVLFCVTAIVGCIACMPLEPRFKNSGSHSIPFFMQQQVLVSSNAGYFIWQLLGKWIYRLKTFASSGGIA